MLVGGALDKTKWGVLQGSSCPTKRLKPSAKLIWTPAFKGVFYFWILLRARSCQDSAGLSVKGTKLCDEFPAGTNRWLSMSMCYLKIIGVHA